MGHPAPETIIYWPALLYGAAVLVVVASMVGLSYFLGQRSHEKAKVIPYESGILSTGSARVRLSPSFYLVAVFFVVFDLESVYVVAWAAAATDPRVGWLGYTQMCVFIGVVLATLAYLWRQGALEQ